LVVTLNELSAIVAALEGEACTPSRVRAFLVRGRLATEAAPRTHGGTRLYGPADVALVRLAVRLQRQGLSAWVARVCLTYLRRELVEAWRTKARLVLNVTGVRGTLARTADPAATACVPLGYVWAGIEGTIRRYRADRPAVWIWNRQISLGEVSREATP
jgi:hypothetical protein